MTNVSSTPAKVGTRRGLFALGIQALEADGWKVSRIARGGKASLRQITRGGETAKVSIRTSQDSWIAFPPKRGGKGWVTLDDVDFVVAVSVNDKFNPTEARVHLAPADDVRDRFDRAYAARKAAGYTLPEGRGIWLSLYDLESHDPVTLVGAGLGVAYPPMLIHDMKMPLPTCSDDDDDSEPLAKNDHRPDLPALTIPEAKRLLAASLGVPEKAIRITIEH